MLSGSSLDMSNPDSVAAGESFGQPALFLRGLLNFTSLA